MNWISINGSLSMASSRGYSYSVRKLSSGGYLVKQDSYTNGRQQQTVKSEKEAFDLAEKWDSR